MLGVISITYYIAIERVNAGSQILKVSMAKQDMTTLDERILSVLFQPGSSRTLEFGDYGGTLNVRPSSNAMVINVTDNEEIAATVFNSTLGRIAYELPYSESAETGLFLRGDSYVVVNRSSSEITQLYVANGLEHPEIILSYRPTVSSISQTENNQTVNDVRIYIVNLNSSQDIYLKGKVPLRISCSRIETTVTSYNVSYQPSTLTMTVSLNGIQGQIAIPLSSTVSGANINIEVIACNIRIERWVR